MLKTFVEAASRRSVADAAKELQYSESTVTYHIREVEKVCRAELFERRVRGLTLTHSGRVALDIARLMLALSAALETLPAHSSSRRSVRAVVRTGGKDSP